MVQWANKLYIGDKIKKKASHVIDSINNGKKTINVCCIAFASQPDNLFDIMNANELLSPHYKNINIKIIGLAKDKDEAIDLVHGMIMEVYKATGDFDVRSYFT